MGLLLNSRRALGTTPAPTCASADKAQYVIFNTSGNGDPINANVPGTYTDPLVVHSADATMAPTQLTIQGQTYTAAAPWASLPQTVLDRMCFWHLMTNTPVHPKEPDVLKLMGSLYAGEMLPSLLAAQLAPCLGTIQAQPLCIGATSPSEGLSFSGTALPIVPPLALKATLANQPGPLTDLQPLRDQTLAQIYELYKNDATNAQRAYIDSLVLSQQQVRNINQNLMDSLTAIKDNSPSSQILAATILIQMKVSPVISVHVPFGGDNHRDLGLATESVQTVSGVATIASLMQQLADIGLADAVTFMSLNVFGRTLGPGNSDGRQHNPNHQVSISIGKPFKGSVIGGIAPVQNDYGALPIDSNTGAGTAGGNILPADSLGAFGMTMLSAVGVAPDIIASQVSSGQIIKGALV